MHVASVSCSSCFLFLGVEEMPRGLFPSQTSIRSVWFLSACLNVLRPFYHTGSWWRGWCSFGEYGWAAAEDVYFQQFWGMHLDNCGLRPQPPSDRLVSFPQGREWERAWEDMSWQSVWTCQLSDLAWASIWKKIDSVCIIWGFETSPLWWMWGVRNGWFSVTHPASSLQKNCSVIGTRILW